MNANTRPSAARARMALAAKLLAVAAGLALLILLGREAGAAVPRFSAWVNSLGAWAPLVFIAGYAVAVVGFVPGSLLTLAAGAIFGLVQGTLYVLIAATLGAAGAFLVARHLARPVLERTARSCPVMQSLHPDIDVDLEFDWQT